jgi:L-ascorbate metabolism protein UlaG (beta-lactamase superfamily)
MPRKIFFRGAWISRLGYAGLEISCGDFKLCIDPGEAVVGCNAILCTHSHPRHCPPTALQLEIPTYSPFTGVIVRPGMAFKVGEIEVATINAYNNPEIYGEASPHPPGFGVGYILRLPGGATVLHTGDTSLIEDHFEIKRVDVAALPVGGGSVLSPEEALELVKTVKPAISIPIHYDRVEQAYKFRDLAQPYTQVVLLWV